MVCRSGYGIKAKVSLDPLHRGNVNERTIDETVKEETRGF